MQAHRSRGRNAFRTAARSEAGRSEPGAKPTPHDGPPKWTAGAHFVSLLARTGAVFSTAATGSNWISAYERGRRVMVASDGQSGWVQIEHIRSCWERFERLGRIHRRDVLEPGRRSAFMMALFEQLPGVRREERDGISLVLERPGRESGSR